MKVILLLATGLLLSSGCKSTEETATTKDILGQDYDAPAQPPQVSQLLTQRLRAVYTSSGFAGPKVSIYDADDAVAVQQGHILSISTSCQVNAQTITCARDGWTLAIAKAPRTAKWTNTAPSVVKPMTCRVVNVPGMVPTQGFDCVETASGD
jgi:hypothetical protein